MPKYKPMPLPTKKKKRAGVGQGKRYVGRMQAKGKLGKFDQAQYATGRPTIVGRKKRLKKIDKKKRPAKYKKLMNKLAELRTMRRDPSRRAK